MYIPSVRYGLIIRPNNIDAPWEIVEGYELEPIGFYDTFNEAFSHAVEVAKRAALMVGYAQDPSSPIKTLRDFRSRRLDRLV